MIVKGVDKKNTMLCTCSPFIKQNRNLYSTIVIESSYQNRKCRLFKIRDIDTLRLSEG